MAYDLSGLSTDTMERLRDTLLERKKFIALNGLAAYRPHPKQDWFHKAGWVKFRYLRTGNRFGKTDCGTAEDVAFALGERPWYAKDDPARYAGIPKSATTGIILCTDWEKANEIFTNEVEGEEQGKLWKYIPKASFVRRSVNHSGHINRIVIKSIHGGESVIRIDTMAGFKLNEQRGESSRYHWIHVDEPIPEPMWNSYARGLIDKDGSAWFTCTPIAQPWINKFFLPKARYEVDTSKPFLCSKREDGAIDRIVIVGSSYDNPHIPRDATNAFVASLSQAEKAARLFGRPIDQAGAVHPDFDTTTHCYFTPPTSAWKDIHTPPLDHTIYVAIDPHPHTPHAVLFAAVSPQGQVFFYNEIFERCDPASLADQILAKIDGYYCPTILMDPFGFNETMDARSTFADDLAEHGIFAEKASKDLKRGILTTNTALTIRGFLKFAGNLTETMDEFDTYVFQDPLKRPDKPVDKNDHMMENLHRLILNGMPYINPVMYDVEIRESANYLLAV